MSNISNIKRASLWSCGLVAAVCLGLATSAAYAAPAVTNNGTPISVDQTHLQTIIAKGGQEITRRLTTLGSLSSKINSAAKLNANDKSYLVSEVNAEISGLTALKAKLDAETTLAAAKADAQSTYSEYRVYALVVPKVALIKMADDQQVSENRLQALAQKLQTRINSAKDNGKDVTTLQTELGNMMAQTNNAAAISSGIEQKVLTLQPSDYDSNHAVLSGDRDQLKNAHADNQAAVADVKNLVSALKNM